MTLPMISKRKMDDTEGQEGNAHPEPKFLKTSVDEKPTLERVYTCKTCGKGFLTFQALGGHRASHTNINKAKTDHDLAVGFGMVKSHDCSVCGAKFFSGQALGGHMRSHQKVTPEKVVSDDGKSGSCSSEVNDTLVTWDFFAIEPVIRVKALVETVEDLSGLDWLDLKLGF